MDYLNYFSKRIQAAFHNPTFKMKRAVILAVVSNIQSTNKNFVVTGHVPLGEISDICNAYLKEKNETPTLNSGDGNSKLSSNYIEDGNSIRQKNLGFQL